MPASQETDPEQVPDPFETRRQHCLLRHVPLPFAPMPPRTAARRNRMNRLPPVRLATSLSWAGAYPRQEPVPERRSDGAVPAGYQRISPIIFVQIQSHRNQADYNPLIRLLRDLTYSLEIIDDAERCNQPVIIRFGGHTSGLRDNDSAEKPGRLIYRPMPAPALTTYILHARQRGESAFVGPDTAVGAGAVRAGAAHCRAAGRPPLRRTFSYSPAHLPRRANS